jgi:UDP-glucose 4-epimerase
VREAGRTPVPLPEFVLEGLIGRFGFPILPKGALTHIKYPVVVDAKAFRQVTGFSHRFDEIAAIDAFREAFPVPR